MGKNKWKQKSLAMLLACTMGLGVFGVPRMSYADGELDLGGVRETLEANVRFEPELEPELGLPNILEANNLTDGLEPEITTPEISALEPLGADQLVEVGGSVKMPWGETFNVNCKNNTVIAMGGKQWYVIGAENIGVASEEGTMTLLAKDVMGKTNFSSSDNNEYGVSNLKTAMDNLAKPSGQGSEGLFKQADLNTIRKITLTGDSDNTNQSIAGADVDDAILWPLDVTEALSLNTAIRGSDYWLRSPYSENEVAALMDESGELASQGGAVSTDHGVRPAFKLNISNVLFSTNQENDMQKLRIISSDLALKKATTNDTLEAGAKIKIKYEGATPSKAVSSIIKYYDGYVIKYENLGKSGDDGSGSAEMTLPENFNSNMEICFFTEETNVENEPNYVSKIVPLQMTDNVMDITKVPKTATVGVDLALMYSLLPERLNKSGRIEFKVTDDGGTGAEIKDEYEAWMLSTQKAGEVTVTATVQGQDCTKDFKIFVNEAASAFAGGDGTKEKPYEIATQGQLILLSKLLDFENPAYAAYAEKHYLLIQDIDLKGVQWKPIGTRDYSFEAPPSGFRGTFDGGDHTISNMELHYAKGANCNDKWNTAGLFGYVNGAELRNLKLSGTVESFYTLRTGFDLGLLGGRVVKTKIENISVGGRISQGIYNDGFNYTIIGGAIGLSKENTISKSESRVDIEASYSPFDKPTERYIKYIGGFVGQHSGGVTQDCISEGRIKLILKDDKKRDIEEALQGDNMLGDESMIDYYGGFAGQNTGTINRCSSKVAMEADVDTILAGFTSINAGKILNSSSQGSLSAGEGAVLSGFAFKNRGEIANCFSHVTASGACNEAASSGFVYKNDVVEWGFEKGTGKITNSYAAKSIGQAGSFAKENEDGATLKYAYISGDESSTETPVTIIQESKMKLAAGTEGSLVDILNRNRESENPQKKQGDGAEGAGGPASSDGENSQGDWKLWTVIADENGGFPAFGEPKPIESHEVTFNSNGGTAVALIKVTEGSLLAELPQTTKAGNIFKGWYKEPAFTSEWNLATDKVTGVTTLYAKWELIPVTPDPVTPDPVTPDPVTPVTPEPGGGSSGGGGGASKPSETATKAVNSKAENIGKETQKEENGKKVVEISINPEAMIETISKDGKNTAEIRVADTDSQIARVLLTGDIVKKLEDNKATILVARNKVQYDIPAEGLDIDSIAKKLNVDSSKLKEIQIEIELSKVSDELTAKYQEISKVRNNQALISPIEFKISAKTAGKDGKLENLDIDKFQGFVDIVIEIPEAAALNKITTGVTLNQDGNYSHIPSEIFKENNRYYARIHSLTNSTYSVIYNPITVDSVKLHWSESSVNDMASRLVLVDTKSFEPNKAISRAEFANYIVRALGLYQGDTKAGQSEFTDVKSDNPSLKGITIASQWGIIGGYPDGSFRPQNTITREEAMSMYSRAMDIAQMEKSDDSRILNYKDRAKVSSWAYKAVQKTLGSGVFNGRTAQNIEPKGTFTCSEAAVAIRNLLIKAELING